MKRSYSALLILILAVLAFCACSQTDSPVSGTVASASDYVISADIHPPVFSHETGCYEKHFTLTVTAPEGTVVHYTLDGSEPTADSETFPADGLTVNDRSREKNVLAAIDASQFTAESDHTPPKVSKGTVIRAAAFDGRGSRSATATATYLVGLDYDGITVISLVMNSNDLFDYNKGIYVFGRYHDEWLKNDPDAKDAETWELEGNFSQKGRAWERPVTVQVIETDGTLGIEQEMGIRIMGSATRRYYQKNFRLFAREEYGSKHFDYPLIDGLVSDSTGEPLDRYKSFILRNGGNDYGYALIRDPFIQCRVTDRDFATQASEPAIVFINGEYWGLYSITEDYSDNYVQYNYGVDNENVVIVKNFELEEGIDGDMELFAPIDDAMYGKNFNKPENYEWLCGILDMQSFIDYLAVNLYINNEDGLFQGNNWVIWRARETDTSNEYADGRWRFMLCGAEFSLGLYNDGNNYTDNTLEEAVTCGWGWGRLLERLLENDEFRTRFINTFMDLRNTAYLPSDAVTDLTLLKLDYEPFAEENYKRNGPAWVIKWTDLGTRMTSEVNFIRKFINGRYGYSVDMLSETLGLGDCCTLKVNADGACGTVTVNTVTPDFSGGNWQGEYFAGVPVTLTAVPADGYTFAGWTGCDEVDGPTAKLTMTGDTEVTAMFAAE